MTDEWQEASAGLWSEQAPLRRRDARAAGQVGLPTAVPVTRRPRKAPIVHRGGLIVAFGSVAVIGVAAMTAGVLSGPPLSSVAAAVPPGSHYGLSLLTEGGARSAPDTAEQADADSSTDAVTDAEDAASDAPDGPGEGAPGSATQSDGAEGSGPGDGTSADTTPDSAPPAPSNPPASNPPPSNPGTTNPGSSDSGSGSAPAPSTPGGSGPAPAPSSPPPAAPQPTPDPPAAPTPAAPKPLAFTGLTAHYGVKLLFIKVLASYTLSVSGEPGSQASISYGSRSVGTVTFDNSGRASISIGGALLDLGGNPVIRVAYSDGTAGGAIEARRDSLL